MTYRVIAKTNSDEFKKWHVSDLLKFTIFLDKNYPKWRFFNVFEYVKGDLRGGKQIASYTNRERPQKRFI